ncbi:MAG TPA: hypothetical protein VKN99_15640 [Polyangia bacterium]|nr:hypothetical protein [Polyangia bacterium]
MRWVGTALLVFGLGVLAVRCDDGSPALQAVEPSSGPNDRAVAVVIHARALAPLVGVDVGCNGHATANAHFDATLDTYLLQQVTWQSNGDLSAIVPPGLPPRPYDLHVMPPGGELLTLPQAYRVLPPGGGDGGLGDAGTCATLYASSQVVVGPNHNNGDLALGPPDGMAGVLTGQWAANRTTWTFSFDPSSLSGTVTARVSSVLWVSGGYVDDRVVLESSGDSGQTWTQIAQWGGDSGITFPTLRAVVGPFFAPNITMAPGLGQAQVRIRGDGAVGPRDGFMLFVDAVELDLCQ